MTRPGQEVSRPGQTLSVVRGGGDPRRVVPDDVLETQLGQAVLHEKRRRLVARVAESRRGRR